MSDMTREQMEQIRQCRFALLPPRIKRQDEEPEKETDSDKAAVQCQVCGRVGMMNLEEMQKHHELHEQERAKV